MSDESIIEELDEDEEPSGPGSVVLDILEWVFVFAVAYGLFLGIRNFVLEPFIVPSGSMLETIQLSDRLFVEKLSYRFHDPEQGDIVMFADPEDPDTTLVKRVIATEGQEVDLVDGTVYVDGEALDEEYTLGKPSDPIGRHAANLSADLTYPLEVPDGCMWVMGDNRTVSLDSRYFGPVSYDAVVGRAMFVYYPFEAMRFL